MFEKDAEEIAKDIYVHHFDDDVNYPDVLQAITVGVQKGAEFGYNKANEWHYVKDGDLPKKFGYFLTSLKSNAYKGFVFEVAYFTGNIFTKDGEVLNNAFAWKEIVLPKENE